MQGVTGEVDRAARGRPRTLGWFAAWGLLSAFCFTTFGLFFFVPVGLLAGCIALFVMPTRSYRLPGPLGWLAGLGAAIIALEFLIDRGCGLDDACGPRPLPIALGLAAIAGSTALAWLIARRSGRAADRDQ
jgi:hypothetical protein